MRAPFLSRQTQAFRRTTTALATALVLFGVVAAPFCRCACTGSRVAVAAVAQAPSCHGTAGHHCNHCKHDSKRERTCEHSSCAGMTITPQETSGSAPSSAVSVGAVHAMALLPALQPVAGQARVKPGADRDLGPPLPLPLFSILRA
jgi:hypothetical protein